MSRLSPEKPAAAHEDTAPISTNPTSCDRCCAEAQHAALKGTDVLFFCGHHHRKAAVGLAKAGWDSFKMNELSNV